MSTYPFKLDPDALALWRFERRIGGQKTVGGQGRGRERGVVLGVGCGRTLRLRRRVAHVGERDRFGAGSKRGVGFSRSRRFESAEAGLWVKAAVDGTSPHALEKRAWLDPHA